ncbi:MAG: hypothetical protein LC648_10840 [Novosphingobium sp.]|nr:hypothetical protein [Novosphingobium sp.]
MIAALVAVKTTDTVDAKEQDWAAQWAAAQAWWREAGVDLDFADAPTDWLAGARAAPSLGESPRRRGPQAEGAPLEARGPRLREDAHGSEEPPKTRIGGDHARWPTTLIEFGEWWLTEPSLDPAPAARRVLPAGPAGAPLMVVVSAPEAEDRESLLSGRQGRLLDAILAAFGHARGEVYLATALPSPAAVTDWAALGAAGMDQVLARHIALAAPRRLIVFGRDISPLLGHDPAQAAQSSLHFSHQGTSLPLAFAPTLEALLERPALKRGLWRRWLDWTRT